jgi:hypothetical protein
MAPQASVATIETLRFRCTDAKERLEAYIAEVS